MAIKRIVTVTNKHLFIPCCLLWSNNILEAHSSWGGHKLYKSGGDPRIFRRCLLFDIGSSSADFLDLEPCRKVSQPPGDCSAAGRFYPLMTKFSADVLEVSRQRSSGLLAVTAGSPVDHRMTPMNPTVTYSSPTGDR